MSKPHFRLRLVGTLERQPAALSHADRLAAAIAYLRSRNLYVLDSGSKKPNWGMAHVVPEETALMRDVMEADRRRK